MSIDKPVLKKQKYIENKELLTALDKIKNYTKKLQYKPLDNPFEFNIEIFQEKKYLLDISYGIQKCMSKYGIDTNQVSLDYIHN